jgi:uncharacterized membrane protein
MQRQIVNPPQKQTVNPNYPNKLNWLRIFLIITLLLGISFRFVNLGKKVYWYDEAITSLRVSGYTREEFIQEAFNDQIISVNNLQKYQQPNSDKNFSGTVKSLVGNVHPPLYFLLTRFWMQLFGNSIAVTRSFSAVTSLLVFPCLYWLCRELFELPLVAWIAMALVSVSPFHVLYAQEARMYSLMTVVTVLSSASLLYALRVDTKRSWLIYALSLIVGFYSHLYFLLIAFGHAIYVFIIERFQPTKIFITYLVTSIISFLTFVPWVLVILFNLDSVKAVTSGAQQRTALLRLVVAWGRNLGQVFIDVNLGNLIAPIILVLAGYALYFLYKNSSEKIWLFILTFIGITAAMTILPDVILGGSGSMRSRYFIPCYLGIQIAVAYLVATKITSRSFWQRSIWSAVMAVLISGGVVSCLISSQAEAWWNKGHSQYMPEVARQINQAGSPLLLNDTNSFNTVDVLVLSHLLDQKVQLILTKSNTTPEIPDRFGEVFLYNPSKELREDLEKDYQLKNINKRGKLWQLIGL